MPSGGERDHDAAARPERMTVDERLARVQDGLARYGEGFLAYLLLPELDHSDPALTDHFVDVYAGWYPDWRSFASGQVEALGWVDALADFRKQRGLPEHALDFDWGVIYEHCCEVYSVIERLGGVHVFAR